MHRKIIYPSLGSVLLVLIMLALATTGVLAAPIAPPGRGAAPTAGLRTSVNYAHDWVCVDGAPSNAQLQITVKRGGDVLATLSALAAGDGSYCSFQHNDWVSGQPDIHVGDAVTVTAGGATAIVDPVGEIAGTLDVATATVTGALHVPSLAPNMLKVTCEVWVDGANFSPIERNNVAADGGAYTCNFGAQGFHMAPGDNIAVRYDEPDGDQVINVFRAPAPDLNINVWNEGPAVAGAGGLALFHIRYQNKGEAPAADVVITDTLPADVTFVQGTAPVPPGGTLDQVVWHLGTLQPGADSHFFVVLANTLAPGATLTNTVAMGTSSPGDNNPGDNQGSVSIPVRSGAPDMRVDQSANPGDPLSGDAYTIDLDFGNNGQVPAGPVQLHLDLPAGTTLESYDGSQNGYDPLWSLTSSAGNHLVFEAPALPAGFGDKLRVVAGIAQAVGSNVQLSSTAWIEVPGDTDPTNDGPVTRDVWTGPEQRPDLRVQKRWEYGILAPGGPAWYRLDYGNDGNLTQAGVRLTDTLPAGTHFVEATIDSNWGYSQQVPPVYQAGNVLAWDLGTLPPAQGGSLNVKLALDGVTTGATITNTAYIGGLNRDQSWWNNYALAVERVNPAGANLRIRQKSYWEGPGQVRFELQFENAGTTIVNNVRITDTVPAGLQFSGNWWGQWWGDLTYDYNPATRQIVWTISRLEPTWAGGVNVRFNVPQADINHQGLQYTNAAQITPQAADVSLADNSTTAVAYTGPDLFVRTSLWAGKLVPGAIVTFAVDFGNRNNGPWQTAYPGPDRPGVLITDTLPAGMTFISATNPWSPSGDWTPQQDGNRLIWGMGNVCSDCRFGFLVTVRIDKAVLAGTNLTNVIEIRDLVPSDVDPFPANDTGSWQGVVRGMTYLPVLRRP